MTIAHDAPIVRAPSVTAALGTLRAHGLRVSLARRRVLDVLYEINGPVSAEVLTASVPGADLASVYRNLVVLEEVGLVRHVHMGHGPGLYSIAAAKPIEFLTCERCQALETVEPRRLDHIRELIAQEFGYRARFTHFPIVGTCAECQSLPDEGP
jgi:Fur family ferric uptake transcriptional regulator